MTEVKWILPTEDLRLKRILWHWTAVDLIWAVHMPRMEPYKQKKRKSKSATYWIPKTYRVKKSTTAFKKLDMKILRKEIPLNGIKLLTGACQDG